MAKAANFSAATQDRTMPTLVFLSFPAYGHVNPSLGLVKELVRAGFNVLYYASEEFKELVLSTGAEFRDYGVKLPGLDFSINLVHSTNLMLERSQLLYERMLPELKLLRPDLIIHDGVCGWGKYIAAFLKIPAVSSIVTFAMNKQLLTGMQSLSDNLGFFYHLFLTSYGKRFFALMEKHNQRLRECGLAVPAGGRLDLVDFSTSPERCNIVYVTREWQPQGERFDDSYKFVGPSIAVRRADDSFVFPGSGKRPVVYLSMGTIQAINLHQYRTFFSALGTLDVQVILYAGSGIERLSQEQVPANVAVYSTVSQLSVLKGADLFISHGGLNSVMESMHFGVPMVVIPITREQMLNGRRVQDAGAGILLSKLEAHALRAAVETILRDGSYRQRARAVSEDFKRAPGLASAVTDIAKYLGVELPLRPARNEVPSAIVNHDH